MTALIKHPRSFSSVLCGKSRGLLFATLLFLTLMPDVNGQTFDSGSTGADGALDLSAMSGELVFDPSSFNPAIDADGDNVFHFTSVIIPSSLTVKLRAPELNFAPVYWLASDAVIIDGVIDLSGEAGHSASIDAKRFPSMPGPGGFPGGLGSTFDSNPTSGFGPGGGGPLAGGSYGTQGGFGPPPYGNLFLRPLIGGSGGGGEGSTGVLGAGGGAGGGAILIASSVSITVDGIIQANGATPMPVGGGAGGGIRLLAPEISGSGQVNTFGGTCFNCQHVGGAGRIRLDSFDLTFTGALNGVFRTATLAPNTPFMPVSPYPSVRVTTVDGVPVPSPTSNSFIMPDININNAQPVTLEIEANHIPLGSAVDLYLLPESGPDQVVTSSPLTGVEDLSTATAEAAFTSGVSSCFVYASWTP